MNKKKEEKHNPIPHLMKPRSTDKIFTYSENQLLDQITTEIMEAWREDLKVIRNHHREILAAEKAVVNLSDKISKEFPELENFLNKNNFISTFNEFHTHIRYIRTIQEEISSKLFNLDNLLTRVDPILVKADYSTFKEEIKKMTKVREDLESFITEMKKPKKKWIERFFGAKEVK